MNKSCKECNAKLSAANKFCPECGNPVPKEEPKVQEIKQFPPIMTLNQAAEFLGVSKCHMYSLIKKDGLPWFPLGASKRFITDELISWAKKRSKGVGAPYEANQQHLLSS
jgi:excisionase family DNA binding protein